MLTDIEHAADRERDREDVGAPEQPALKRRAPPHRYRHRVTGHRGVAGAHIEGLDREATGRVRGRCDRLAVDRDLRGKLRRHDCPGWLY